MGLSDNQTLQLLTYVSHYMENVMKVVDGCNEYKLYVIKDISIHKLSRKRKNKKHTSNNFMVIDYVNGLIDDINLTGIMHKRNIKNLFPHNSDFGTPSLSSLIFSNYTIEDYKL